MIDRSEEEEFISVGKLIFDASQNVFDAIAFDLLSGNGGKGFSNSGIDTFTNMADKGLLIIDKVVTSQLNGSIDSEKGQWVIPN